MTTPRDHRPRLRIAGLMLAAPAMLLGACSTAPPRVVNVSPPTTSPGRVVVVTTSDTSGPSGKPAQVLFGDTPAAVLGPIVGGKARVVVPDVDGDQPVRLRRPGQDPGRGVQVHVEDPLTREVLVEWREGDVVVLDSSPREVTFPSPAPGNERRISYDVYNGVGGLIFSGSLPHPATARFEVYGLGPDGREQLHLRPAASTATLALAIPNIPGLSVVRFFEVGADVDLDTEKGRAARAPLGEAFIKGDDR